MKKTRIVLLVSAVMLTSAVSSAPVLADDHGGWDSRGGDQHGHDGPGHFRGDHGPGGRGPQGWHHGGPHWQRPGRGNSFAWHGHHFEPGHRFPRDFRGPRYRVDDWQRRGLPAPPYGHRWSYIDGNYVLVAVATGIISSIILNNALNH